MDFSFCASAGVVHWRNAFKRIELGNAEKRRSGVSKEEILFKYLFLSYILIFSGSYEINRSDIIFPIQSKYHSNH